MTIAGTSGPDRLLGTDGRDVIAGLGGDDEILGGDGGDRICGGAGMDVIDGRYGGDRIDAGEGHDEADGGPGADLLLGGRGRDSLTGGDGEGDTLVGADGSDRLFGGDGQADSDWVFGGAANDFVAGGLGGDDRLYGGTGNDYLSDGTVSFEFATEGVTADVSVFPGPHARGEGNDTLSGVGGITGSEHSDVLTGGDHRDVLRGRGGDDVVDSGAGTDEVDGGPGSDDLDGGTDLDLLSFVDSPAGVRASLRDATADGVGSDSLAGFEDLEGSFFDDELTGDDARNRILATHGSDTVFALGGDDYVELAEGGDAGGGIDECMWGFQVANCEAQGHFDPPPLPYVSDPTQRAGVTRLGVVSGGTAGGLGPSGDVVEVGVRRVAPDGCWWWDARKSAFVRGHCGKTHANEVPVEDGRWSLPVNVTLRPGVYVVSVRWRNGRFGECGGAFEPMCVELVVP